MNADKDEKHMGKMDKGRKLCQMKSDQIEVVTKLKWSRPVPALLPRALPGWCVVPVHGALYSGIMQQPPKISLLLQNPVFYGITLRA